MIKFILICFGFTLGVYSQTTTLSPLPNYSWNGNMEPKTFAKKLQLSFVHPGHGFPSYGSVLAGNTYSTTQDGGAFQLYFPYGTSHGGVAPKIRLGKYNNQGWSEWATFLTSANANRASTDWTARKMFVADKIGINDNNPITKIDLGNNYSDPSTYPNKIALWYGGANNYMGFGVSSGDLDYISQNNHKFHTQYNGSPGSEKMVILANGNVGIGTSTTGIHKLAVEGSVGAREIKVQASGWSDFVFEEDYKLPSLKEVSKHIKEKGHLQDIPSSKDVLENGFFLGEMDSKLLQKIEELILYTIEQQNKIEYLEKEILSIKNRL